MRAMLSQSRVFSSVGMFLNFVRTSKLGADKLVSPLGIYNYRKHFIFDFPKTLCGTVLTSVYVPTPLVLLSFQKCNEIKEILASDLRAILMLDIYLKH